VANVHLASSAATLPPAGQSVALKQPCATPIDPCSVVAEEAEIDLASTRADSGVTELLGREDELAQLHDLIDGIGQRGGALVVRGDAGIGKSALLEAAARRAREREVTVVSATGMLSEARFAFAGLHQLLLPLLEARDRLPQPQRRALETALGLADGDAPDPFLVGLAALGLVTEAETKRPILLLVEDAQWLDAPSSEVLGFVARRLEHEPVIVLFAVREGVPSAVDESGLAELRVAGLDDGAAKALLELTAPDLPAHLEARILEEAAGNPLALLELPVAAASLDGAEPVDGIPLSTRLEQAFAARLADLDSDTRRWLLLAALEDGELPGLTREPAWEHAVAAGLGIVDHGTFRFRHPLIRSAVAQAATPEQRRQAHAALAQAFQNDPDRAVWHRAAAAHEPEEEIALALDAAAERARLRGSRDVAQAALEQAAELSGDPSGQALRLFRAGELAFELGRPTDSKRLLTAAQHLGLPSQQSALASFDVESLEPTWSGAATVRSFARIAQELAEAGHDDQALQTLGAIALRAHWENLDPETRRHVAQIVEQLAGSPDDPVRLSTLALFDPVGHGAEILRRVRRTAPLDVPEPEAQFEVAKAAAAIWAPNLALPFLRAASTGYRTDGRLAPLAQTLVYEAWAEVREGSARVAITAAAEAVQLAQETRQVRFGIVGQLAQAVAAVELGADEDAERLIGTAEAMLLPLGANPLLSQVTLARGRQALAHERYADAYAELLRIFDPNDAGYQRFVGGWVLADLADATLHGDGDRAVVAGLLGEWEAIATATGAPRLDVQLRYAKAILSEDADAEPFYESAINTGADGWPFSAARAQLAYGAWLRRKHRMIDSRAPLREAAQSFEALGLLRYAERARRELRASGEAPRRRVPEAWAQLTPQELQISQLAAEGLSNREIGERLYLSHRTVGSHLYRLFPKLGVTSRAQLRDALGPQLQSSDRSDGT
jgi:DNA-binding NarL/FixJ family response regulator